MKAKSLFPGFLLAVILGTGSCLAPAAYKSKIVFTEEADSLTVGRTYEKKLDFAYEIKDFEPVTVKVPPFDAVPSKAAGTNEYFSTINNAVTLMRKKDYRAAVAVLEPAGREYKDEGLALYNLGVCYLNLKDYEAALARFAWSHAAGFADAFSAIDGVHTEIAFGHFEKKNYGEAIRYFKTVPAREEISMNVIYSYMELSKALPRPQNLIMLLYAGNYIVDNGVLDPNILSLGTEIGCQLGDAPEFAYLRNAILILEYLAAVKNDPWLHINLGMLYDNDSRPDKAREQFKLAAARAGHDQDAFVFASGRLVEMEKTTYAYLKEVRFTITPLSGDLGRARMDWLLTPPQNGLGQGVSGLELAVNGKPLAFKTIKDRYQAEFISADATGALKTGENVLSVRARVEKEAVRFSPQGVSEAKVSHYDKRAPRYKLYTESSAIFDLSHPLVKKGVAGARRKMKGNDLRSIVNAVYEYVMEKMSYELYDNAKRLKKEILSRLEKTDGVGLCEDYAVYTVCLLRALGVPSLVLTGPTYNADVGHAWPAFYPPDFKLPIVLDATWGDTGRMPNYYFLFNTNQTVIDGVAWDSDVLPGAQSCSFKHGAEIKVEFIGEKTALTKSPNTR